MSCPNLPLNTALPSYAPTTCCSDPYQLGIGYNQGIFDYAFGSQLNTAFCGVSLPAAMSAYGGVPPAYDCEKCPCAVANHSCMYPNSRINTPCCDYGYARNMYSYQGPSSGNRSGTMRWG